MPVWAVLSTLPPAAAAAMARPSLYWVNTPVLLLAIERYEQGLLPRSMQLWIESLLEIRPAALSPLRPGC